MVRATAVILAVFMLLFTSLDLAQAARLGGGRSTGNRQSFSQSVRPDMGAPSGAFGSQQSSRPSQSYPGGPTNPTGSFSRPGWGGMLGGLLVGGLLGSMLFGGGGAHMGGGPGLLDLLLIGGGLYLLFRFLRGRRTATATGPTMARTYNVEPQQPTAAGSGWDSLSSAPAQPQAGPATPAGFDTADFLSGAKTLYSRLQRSWSARDLNDIAAFSTPAFMEDVRRQAAEDPNPTPTDVLLVDAKLLEVRQQGPLTIASAYFDTLLREDPKADRPQQAREVWHFVRREDTPHDTWRLDAIQQLEG